MKPFCLALGHGPVRPREAGGPGAPKRWATTTALCFLCWGVCGPECWVSGPGGAGGHSGMMGGAGRAIVGGQDEL